MTAANEGGPLESATLRLINSVAFVSSSRTHTRRVLAATGIELPPSDLRFLEWLNGRGPVGTKSAATELRIALTQASRQATQLEAAGHVIRSTDRTDRRRSLLRLSPPTAALLDKYVLTWSGDFGPPAEWTAEEVASATEWFDLALRRLCEALPDRPRGSAADRWAEVAGPNHEPTVAKFLTTMIGLVTWVGLSNGFNDLLQLIGSPVRQPGLVALNLVAHSGPLSVAEVADRLGIEPSRASKRLRQLTDLGLVDRDVDAVDRRSRLVHVSQKGLALIARVEEVQLETFKELAPAISPEQRRCWTPLVADYVDSVLDGRRTRPVAPRREAAEAART